MLQTVLVQEHGREQESEASTMSIHELTSALTLPNSSKTWHMLFPQGYCLTEPNFYARKAANVSKTENVHTIFFKHRVSNECNRYTKRIRLPWPLTSVHNACTCSLLQILGRFFSYSLTHFILPYVPKHNVAAHAR